MSNTTQSARRFGKVIEKLSFGRVVERIVPLHFRNEEPTKTSFLTVRQYKPANMAANRERLSGR